MSNTTDSEPFFKFYKFLLDEKYKDLSFISKGLYSFICDRVQLSIKNNWKDGNDNTYAYLTKVEAAKIVGKTPKTIHKHFKELVEYGLIIDKRVGLNKPNRIYVTRMCKNYIPRDEKNTHLNITELHTSNTDTSEIESSNTNINSDKSESVINFINNSFEKKKFDEYYQNFYNKKPKIIKTFNQSTDYIGHFEEIEEEYEEILELFFNRQERLNKKSNDVTFNLFIQSIEGL